MVEGASNGVCTYRFRADCGKSASQFKISDLRTIFSTHAGVTVKKLCDLSVDERVPAHRTSFLPHSAIWSTEAAVNREIRLYSGVVFL